MIFRLVLVQHHYDSFRSLVYLHMYAYSCLNRAPSLDWSLVALRVPVTEHSTGCSFVCGVCLCAHMCFAYFTLSFLHLYVYRVRSCVFYVLNSFVLSTLSVCFLYVFSSPVRKPTPSSPYSVSPVGSDSQRLLNSPKRSNRKIPQQPFKVR